MRILNGSSEDDHGVLSEFVDEMDEVGVFVGEWDEDVVLEEGRDCRVSGRVYRQLSSLEREDNARANAIYCLQVRAIQQHLLFTWPFRERGAVVLGLERKRSEDCPGYGHHRLTPRRSRSLGRRTSSSYSLRSHYQNYGGVSREVGWKFRPIV